MNVHRLNGCTPTPLAHYLKALGILRVVNEQLDAAARGMWQADKFILISELSLEQLSAFFLNEYAPTPLISPWNGRSGFYPKDPQAGIQPIEQSTNVRFARYRKLIAWGRQATRGQAKRPEPGPRKSALIRSCREEWGDPDLVWLNAAVAVLGDKLSYTSLLGTGGNDGNFEFSNNYMQRLMELFDDQGPRPDAPYLLEAALLGSTTCGLAAKAAVGQFFPGAAGGKNAGPGYVANSLVNPWDYVFMLEGAVAFQAAAVRQLDSTHPPSLAAPFALRPQAAGYGSAARSEESARGEQWVPLWERPARFTELSALFREGRIRDGKGQAHNPIEAAKALAAHGSARGVSAFQRYGFIERNGLSNLAVPLGRWSVAPSGGPRLLDSIDQWVSRLRRASKDEQRDPNSLRTQVRGLESAMLSIVADPRPGRVQNLLVRLGQANLGLASRPKHTAGQHLRPLPPLPQEWLDAAAEDTAEFRLATACATQWVPADHDNRSRGHGLMAYMVPLEAAGRRFAAGSDALLQDARVVWRGRNLVDDMIRVVQRRAVDSRSASRPGLGFRTKCHATISDVEAFVAGRTNDARIADLIAGLTTLRLTNRRTWPDSGSYRGQVSGSYALIRSAIPCHELPNDGIQLRVDSTTVNYLVNGQLDRSAKHAARTLASFGHRARLHTMIGDRNTSRRLAASLLFPISFQSQQRLLHSITFDSNAQGAAQ